MHNGEHSGIRVHYIRLIHLALLPLGMIIFTISFWTLKRYLCRGTSGQNVTYYAISTILIELFLIHPYVMQSVFSNINCMQVDDVSRLRDDITNICYTGMHQISMFAITYPSIVLWGFGMPLVTLYLLYKNKSRIQLTMSLTSESQLIEKQEQWLLKMKYGFLLNGYKQKYYYWEIVILVKKMLLIFITVYMSSISTEV